MIGRRAQQPVGVEAEFSVSEAVLEAFGVADAQIELLTGGRTNQTMRVRAGRDLVLQHMHAGESRDLLGTMENLVRVTAHLDWKRAIGGRGDSWYPMLVPTGAGKPFIMTEQGDVWRAFAYRQGQIRRSTQPLEILTSAAAIYGRFAAETADLGGPDLIETAPEFHDIDRVHADLHHDLEASAATVRDTLAQDMTLAEAVKARLDARCAADGLRWSPDRVVHNDTKLSNVLFDNDRARAIAVLDLDLAMMGPSWHDLGDLVRSASWHAPETARLHGPAFSPALFEAIARSYVDAAGDTLSPADIVTFAAAGPRLSLELGLRYLNDHIRVEPQLQVAGENGHLLRGRANVKLADEMLGAYDALRHTVDTFVTRR